MTKRINKYKLVRAELEEMLAWATSGARYQSTNPYMIAPIKHAMQVLTELDGKTDYLDLPIDTAKYQSMADTGKRI